MHASFIASNNHALTARSLGWTRKLVTRLFTALVRCGPAQIHVCFRTMYMCWNVVLPYLAVLIYVSDIMHN
jgi:hypothetical protein